MTPEEHSEAEIRGSVARAFDVPERLLGPPSDYLRPLFANPMTRWTPWFAWRPVETSDRGWVWLRWIFRRRCKAMFLVYGGRDVYWQTAVAPHLTQKTMKVSEVLWRAATGRPIVDQGPTDRGSR